MDNNDMDNYTDSIIEYREVLEEELSSVFQETCESDSVEVTTLGNNEDKDINSDCSSYEPKSEFDGKKNVLRSNQDKFDACLICENRVYPMEKVNADGKIYHKNCFRCSKCRTILSVSNFTINNNAIYCKTHSMELFKIRGKFDDDGDIHGEIITGNESEAIPTFDTKGLLAKFRELETSGGCKHESHYINRNNSGATQRYTQPSGDIVKCDDSAPDELPAPETAKSMVAKFKAMERTDNVPSPISVGIMQQKAKSSLTPNANVRLQTSKAKTCVDEDEYNKEQFPEEGTAKNLLSKFQQLSEFN